MRTEKTVTLTYHDGRTEDFRCYVYDGEVADPIIAELGKFEGEPIYVPYFHDMAMNGFEDEYGDAWDAFEVSDLESLRFHDLCKGQFVILHYTDHGFVDSEIGTRKELDAFIDRESESSNSERVA